MSDPAVLVTADLTLTVTAPDGREATIRIDDADGTVRVTLSNGAALLASLPRGASGPGNWRILRTAVATFRHAGVRWEQPVDVVLGERLLLRRRNGVWRPSTRVAAPGAAAAAGVVLLLGGLLLVRRRLLRVVRTSG